MLTGRLAYACLVTSRQQLLCLSTRVSQAAVNRPRQFLYPLQLQLVSTQARHIMSAASDEDVRSTLRQLLPTVDMDTTSERKVGVGWRHRLQLSWPQRSSTHGTPTGHTSH